MSTGNTVVLTVKLLKIHLKSVVYSFHLLFPSDNLPPVSQTASSSLLPQSTLIHFHPNHLGLNPQNVWWIFYLLSKCYSHYSWLSGLPNSENASVLCIGVIIILSHRVLWNCKGWTLGPGTGKGQKASKPQQMFSSLPAVTNPLLSVLMYHFGIFLLQLKELKSRVSSCSVWQLILQFLMRETVRREAL